MTRFFAPLLCLLSLLSACSEEREARPMPESAKAYVYAYTQGVVSRVAPLKVQFSGLVAGEEEVGNKVASGVISMSPNAPGSWTWSDRQTVQFDPDPALDFGTAYLINVSLEDLFDNLPDDARSFEFSVQTRDPFVSIEVDGLSTPDLAQREVQVLKGKVLTSDYLAEEEVPQLLQAEQGNRELDLVWSHNARGTVHYFTVPQVNRGDDLSEVALNWNGAAIGAAQKGRDKVEVPAIGDFKVTAVDAQGGGVAKVDIYFSDPIRTDQDFTGLVNITNSNNNLRYVAEGHVLSVYLNEPLSGNQQLSVYTGIQNRYRETMPRSSVWEVSFTAVEPQVRLAGHGNILPAASKLMFPFEAIGLHTVEVEVFQIYSNNILQFLQDNNVDGNYGLDKVGKVLLRKEVPLKQINPGSSSKEWERYALDLRQFFEVDDKAFYQIRIGFRLAHSNYGCTDEKSFNFVDRRRGDGTLLDSWYGLDGYYTEYRWDQRDDPCYPAYYNSDRFVSRTVMASNLGMIVKGQQYDNYSLAVTNLQTAMPVAGAEVKFYNYQQQLLFTTTTDGYGMAEAELPEHAFFVVAETDNDQAYLRLEDGTALTTSRFDVGGQVIQDGLKGYLYGERGVWRPGDSVFLNFVLEDEQGTLPPDYPVSFEIRDARGQIAIKREGVTPEGDIYPLHFSTQPDDATGVWNATVYAGDATFRKSIRIEAIKPNRIKVALTGAQEPIRLDVGSAEMSLQADWLHGAPASNLKAVVEASFNVKGDGFKAFS